MKVRRKLKLHRETVRDLGTERLLEVNGATGVIGSCRTLCESISYCYACISVPEASCEFCQQ